MILKTTQLQTTVAAQKVQIQDLENQLYDAKSLHVAAERKLDRLRASSVQKNESHTPATSQNVCVKL